jgi:aerobic-type carbon monoxide dehydrogenase small subunit (CoxS/CutS family)
MILTAVALLNVYPQPTDEQIVTWMNGNICRCNGYVKIKNAIRRAATQITEVKKQ